MADIIKVKPKKTYQWNQDQKFVYLQIPLPSHTSLKKVEIFLSDLILRVTSLEKKNTQSLDLAREVDFKSPQNKFLLSDGLLHVTLKKLQAQQQWENLIVEDISLADLRARRRESEARYEQSVKKSEQTKDKLRVEYDRKATQQLMRFEQEERDKLDGKKKQEKENAIREVFSNINEQNGKIEKKNGVELQENKWREKERLALQLIEKEQQSEKSDWIKHQKEKNQQKIIQQIKKKYQKNNGLVSNKTMFTEEEINKYDQMRERLGETQYQEIPVRKTVNQTVKFTEKIYPGLAARDHFYKDPPMPNSKSGKGSNTKEAESQNPLWLKDKGDSFFNNKNYVSAIQAYSQAVKLDAKLFKAYLNRSISYMKVFKPTEAIADCQQCLSLMQSQILGNGEEENSSSHKLFIKIKTRKAICLAWKGEILQSKELLQELSDSSSNLPQIQVQINGCLSTLKNREQSLSFKIRGDQQVKIGNYQSALPHYDRAIEKDENEYAISNKMLCLNKIKQFRNAINLADIAIKRITKLNVGTISATSKDDKQSTLLLLKLYYRKAKALQQLGLINQAEETIRKGLTLDNSDKDLQDFLKIIKNQQAKNQLKKLKQECVELIKEGKVKQSLQNYGKCLKLLQSNQDVQQYLAILQNQCVCYLKLEQYDSVISTSIRILKLVNTIESKILVFGGKKTQNIQKEDLNKISIRTLMRRANAYLKTKQIYNAKSDLEKALEINPSDQTVRKELQKLKGELGI